MNRISMVSVRKLGSTRKSVLAMLSFVSILFGGSLSAQAWGGRGHYTICDAATHLVKDENLKIFLKTRNFMIGHLCNVPDTSWRDLSPEIVAINAPTHYINPEVIGLSLDKVPLDYKEIIRLFTGKGNEFKPGETIQSIPNDLGSVWWRVDQFMREIQKIKPIFATKKPKESPLAPTGTAPLSAPVPDPTALAIYQMMNFMGEMGHFVGDVSQPMHNTADYDGYGVGHGGLHGYYETGVVAEFSESLIVAIVAKAKTLHAPELFEKGTAVERMRQMSVVAISELPLLYKLDPIIEPSSTKDENGLTLKTPAKRQSTKVGLDVYSDLITLEMARSAKLLAILWDEAYASLGSLDLSKYRLYTFPFTPDFVIPDYYPVTATENK